MHTKNLLNYLLILLIWFTQTNNLCGMNHSDTITWQHAINNSYPDNKRILLFLNLLQKNISLPSNQTTNLFFTLDDIVRNSLNSFDLEEKTVLSEIFSHILPLSTPEHNFCDLAWLFIKNQFSTDNPPNYHYALLCTLANLVTEWDNKALTFPEEFFDTSYWQTKLTYNINNIIYKNLFEVVLCIITTCIKNNLLIDFGRQIALDLLSLEEYFDITKSANITIMRKELIELLNKKNISFNHPYDRCTIS